MNRFSFHPPVLGGNCAALALALALTGCAGLTSSNTAVSSSVETPATWRGRSVNTKLDTAGLTRWWKHFRDPALSSLVEDALRSSPDVATAWSKIVEARAQRGVTRAALFPSLSGGVSGQTQRTEIRGVPGATTSENWGASVDASWEVDLFGRQRKQVQAASAAIAQAEEDFYGVHVSLSAEVAEAYLTLRQAQEQLAVTDESVRLRGETTQIAAWKEQAGTAPALETLQARSTLDQARAALPQLQQTIAQTKHQLALLCGKTPGSVDGLLTKARPLPTVPATLAVGIPAETLRQRPDVRAAERGIDAAVATRQAAQLERLPSLNLSGSLGVEALKAGKLFSPEQVIASALGSLTAPLFEGGRITNTIRVQREKETQAVLAYEKTVLTAWSEVENALVAVRRTSERRALLNRAATAAREAATLAQQEFQSGRVDILNVLEAQTTLLNVEEQLVTTRANELIAHLQLYKALGGGWSPL